MVDRSLEEFEKRQTQAAEGGQLVEADSFRGAHGQIVEAIGTAIANGTHSVGDRLFPESLGEDFGVSRTVIREVLKVLEARGMVRARPGSGTRVLPSSEWDLLDSDVIRWQSIGAESGTQVANLTALRSAIESLAARQACQERTPESLTRLRASIDDMVDANTSRDRHRYTEVDVDFHRAVLAASGSMILEQLADPVEAAIRARFRREVARKVWQDMAFIREVISWHEAVVDAIEDRDEGTAELIMRRIASMQAEEEAGMSKAAGRADLPKVIMRTDDGGRYRIRPSNPAEE